MLFRDVFIDFLCLRKILCSIKKYIPSCHLSGDQCWCLCQRAWSLVTHWVKTGDTSPIKQPPRMLPFALRRHVPDDGGNVAQWVVTPSSSRLASPVVLVAKHDGSMLITVDSMQLRSRTVFPYLWWLPQLSGLSFLLPGFSVGVLASGDGPWVTI